jgi:type I restriction enzyme M protein
MKLSEILKETEAELLLETFGMTAIEAIETAIIQKNGKLYVRCIVRNKDILVKKEEIVRQLWIYHLIHHHGYPLKRLAVEYPITFGRDTSNRADIVVFDADRPTVPYIIVEVKKISAKDGKEQLRSYTHATGAPLALWSNGVQPIVWHRKSPNYFVAIPDLPAATQTIEDIAGQPWTIENLVEKEKQREAEGIRARSLRQLIEDMEDEVLANAGVDVFEEVFKLIFTKLYDELACYRGHYKHLRFRSETVAAHPRSKLRGIQGAAA